MHPATGDNLGHEAKRFGMADVSQLSGQRRKVDSAFRANSLAYIDWDQFGEV